MELELVKAIIRISLFVLNLAINLVGWTTLFGFWVILSILMTWTVLDFLESWERRKS